MKDSAASSGLTFAELLAGLRSGQGDEAQEVLARYLHRLLPLIRSRVSAALRPRIDAEDVVQSALGSFFLRATEDRYMLEKSADIWRLLAAISLNKLRRQVEWHSAGKRAMSREVAATGRERSLEASPADAVTLEEELAGVLGTMPSDSRKAIERYLAGESPEQIAAETGKSPRTVRRRIQSFRDQLQQRLGAESVSSTEVQTTLAWEDYILKQHVGSGGFGKVYRAIEKKWQRTVAIKALHKRRQNEPEAVRRFVREAQLLAKISHPAVVGVHGLGQYPRGGYFLVLDWVAGENLQTRIDRFPLPLPEAVRIIRRVAEAAAKMHQRNIIHGDLKPANILVSQSGGVFVTDFGLASLRTQRHATASELGGTLAYLAPEQLSAHPVDFPIDVYGLGGLLYAMLTGAPPRTGSAAAILETLRQGRPPRPLNEMRPELPSGVANLVTNCLASDPQRRIPTVEQFLRELDGLEIHSPKV